MKIDFNKIITNVANNLVNKIDTNKLNALLDNALKEKIFFDDYINDLNDEVAKKTSFLPLEEGGASFKVHKLIYDNLGNIIFKVKKGLLMFFTLMFFIFFSSPFIEPISKVLTDYYNAGYNFGDNINILSLILNLFLGILGVLFNVRFIFFLGLFFVISFFIWKYYPKSFIFDFEKGYFYPLKYKRNIFELINNNNEKNNNLIFQLKDIYALQILKHIVYCSKRNFTIYELNLVFKDGNRVQVTSNPNLGEIRKDAETLNQKLRVKIWDITKILYE